MHFSSQQIASFVAAVRKEFGEGWRLLVPRLQTALIAEKALDVARHRGAEIFDPEGLDELLEAMLVEAGLTEAPPRADLRLKCRCNHAHLDHYNKLAKGIAQPCHSQGAGGRRCDCRNYVPA